MQKAGSQWERENDDDYEAANAELKRRFASWAHKKGVEVNEDAPKGPGARSNG